MEQAIDAGTSYGLGAMCMVIDWNQLGDGFLMWGSVILLVARLAVDVPRAVRAIKSKWRE